MDAQIKAKWVAALRSGEVKQARRCMKTEGDTAYCCLGVLEYIVKADAFSVIPQHQLGVLISMNDGQSPHREHSFPEIADYIEANL